MLSLVMCDAHYMMTCVTWNCNTRLCFLCLFKTIFQSDKLQPIQSMQLQSYRMQ